MLSGLMYKLPSDSIIWISLILFVFQCLNSTRMSSFRIGLHWGKTISIGLSIPITNLSLLILIHNWLSTWLNTTWLIRRIDSMALIFFIIIEDNGSTHDVAKRMRSYGRVNKVIDSFFSISTFPFLGFTGVPQVMPAINQIRQWKTLLGWTYGIIVPLKLLWVT